MEFPSQHSLQNIKGEEEAREIWVFVKRKITEIYGEIIFRSWFRSIEFHCYENGTVFLIAPSRFVRDWIKTNYLDFILRCWSELERSVISIDLIVVEQNKNQGNASLGKKPVQKIKQVSIHRDILVRESDDFFNVVVEKRIDVSSKISKSCKINKEIDLSRCYSGESVVVKEPDDFNEDRQTCFDKRYTFASFVEDESNDLAYFACKTLAEKGKLHNLNYNLLFLYGDVGLGKTHLMHAIANYKLQKFKSIYPIDWLKKFNEKIIYMPSQKFMNDFMDALKSRSVRDFKRQFRDVEILMIDDVQFFMGKGCTQEEFFNVLTSIMNDGKQLIVSADRVPGSLTGFDDKMRSRLGCGLVADIRLGGLKFRTGILRSKSQYLGINFGDEVLEYLAQNIENNIRELEGALNKLVMIQQLNPAKSIDIPCIKDKLRDMLKPQNSNELSGIRCIRETKEILPRIAYNDLEIDNHRKSNENIAWDVNCKKLIAKIIKTDDFTNSSSFSLKPGRRNISRNNDQILHVRAIQKSVCLYYAISFDIFMSADRSEKVSFARQIGMYLVKEFTTLNLKEIAASFSRKNHSTVIHNIQKIEKLVINDINLKNAIDKIYQGITERKTSQALNSL